MRRSMRKIIAAAALTLIAASAVAYVADSLILQLREHHGSAHGSVMVNTVDIVREKGSKVEYYDNPLQPTPCVYALFPHEGEPACWWLARHADQQRYVN
jgi:hypothetical protein